MSISVYAPDDYKRYLDGCIRAMGKQPAPRVTRVPGGTVWPCGKPREHGVYDASGQYIDSSNIIIHDGSHLRRPRRFAALYIDSDVLFLGNLHHHFGHVLLERMTRAWALLDGRYKNMKCAVLYSRAADPLPEYYLEFLAALGLRRDDIIVVRRPTRFKNVYVPEISKSPDYTTDAFADTFDAIADAVVSTKIYDKVYVSRSALKTRRTFGEAAVQSIFERNGFHIIYPETMPIREQIAIVKNCRMLAGCAGTALHLALFMKPGGTVVQIKRNSMNDDNAGEQFLVNMTKGLNSVYIWASSEDRPTRHFSQVPQIIHVGEYMQKFFDDFGFEYSDADIAPDAAEHAAYINALRQYRAQNGAGRKMKRTLIKIMACVIPGRERRGAFRTYMRRRLACD